MTQKRANTTKLTSTADSISPIFGTVLPLLSEFSTEKSLSENYLLKDEKDYSEKITKTKVICTIGPSTCSPDQMRNLLDNGMSVARFNLSHGSFEEHAKLIKQLRNISHETRKFCAVMVDTRGGAIRMANTGGKSVSVQKDAFVTVRAGDLATEHSTAETIIVSEKDITKIVSINEVITIGFGDIKLKITENSATEIKCKFLTDGVLQSSKTIFLPKGHRRHPPTLTPMDLEDLRFAAKVGADVIAASYVVSENTIKAAKSVLKETNSPKSKIFAKIECEDALINFDSILEESDGVIVSRGNLGEEIDLEAVTLAQKLILRKCNSVGKSAVIATQLLDSMRTNPFPTRAEASDVGNAVFDGADAVALGGETAKGQYPCEATKMMAAICKEAERSVDHRLTFRAVYDRALQVGSLSVPEAVASSAVKMSFDLRASVLIVSSRSGLTGRLVSKYRPKCPVLLLTDSETTARQSLLSRSIIPLMVNSLSDDAQLTYRAMVAGIDLGVCKSGDLAVVVKVSEDMNGIDGPSNLVSITHVRA